MKRYVFLSLLILVCSCSKDVLQGLTPNECSGYGYASLSYYGNSESVFIVNSDKSSDVTLSVRCKCSFDYDHDSCSLILDDQTYPIVIPEIGKWTIANVNVKLVEGRNMLVIKALKPIKDNVLIDYIELK